MKKVILIPFIAVPLFFSLLLTFSPSLNSENYILEEPYSSGISNCGCKHGDEVNIHSLESILEVIEAADDSKLEGFLILNQNFLKNPNIEREAHKAFLLKVFKDGSIYLFDMDKGITKEKILSLNSLKEGFFWLVIKNDKAYFVDAQTKDLLLQMKIKIED